MGIYSALQTAVSGLRAQSHAMENISGNIANSQTIGFKKIDTSFVDLIPDEPTKRQTAGAVSAYSRSTNNVRGDIQNAETETYMALNGSGFFVVEPSTGDTSATFYTRRGDFDVDKNGFLVNGAGFKLKGLAMENGVITGSVASAIKVDNSFLPARATTTIDYQLNLPQTPKNAAYVATTPGSELMKPWGYGNVNGTPNAPHTSGTVALPGFLPARASGDALIGTGPSNTSVTDGAVMTVDIGGTAYTVTFDEGGTNGAAGTAITIATGAGITNAQMLSAIEAQFAAATPAANVDVALKNGKVDFAGTTNQNIAISSSAGNILGLNGTYNATPGGSVTAANTPADMMIANNDTLTVDIGGTIRKYRLDTNGTATIGAGETRINASGSLSEMLALIQQDLKTNAGPGGAGAEVTYSGGAVNFNFAGNYTQSVEITGTAATKFNIVSNDPNLTAVSGSVDGILSTDNDRFIKESIAGGGITVYSQTGEPINVQMRWAKLNNAAGNETWSLFYASDSRPGATESWTRLADYAFDQGILKSMTPNPDVATGVGMEQLTIENLSVNGSAMGAVVIDHGLKGITQFADNGGSATTTALEQNGYGAGEFISVGVSDQGRVVASYSNGETREVAQIVIATFNDPNALKRGDGGTYTATTGSGNPVISQDGEGIVGSSTEASNTDISEEFTKLIVTQQAYAANTRVVSTSNDMLQETLNMIR